MDGASVHFNLLISVQSNRSDNKKTAGLLGGLDLANARIEDMCSDDSLFIPLATDFVKAIRNHFCDNLVQLG